MAKLRPSRAELPLEEAIRWFLLLPLLEQKQQLQTFAYDFGYWRKLKPEPGMEPEPGLERGVELEQMAPSRRGE